jgi:hypothetical protein
MHSTFFDLPLFAFLGLEPWVTGIIIPIAGLIFAGVIVVCGMYFKNRQRELWHETARLALEKGQPLPPVFDTETTEDEKSPRDIAPQHDIRGGLVLIAVGFGLWFMLNEFSPKLRFVGAIPGFIGIALLVFATGRALFSSKSSRNDLPPRT